MARVPFWPVRREAEAERLPLAFCFDPQASALLAFVNEAVVVVPKREDEAEEYLA